MHAGAKSTCMTVFEHRVHVRAPADEVFRFLSRPENVPLFAPGIEEAVLSGGVASLQGATLGLRTRTGRELRAQITHYHENENWTVVDERSTVAQVQVEPEQDGTRLTATLSGSWRPDQERIIRTEWERKMAELPRLLAR